MIIDTLIQIIRGIPGSMPLEHYNPINIHGILNLVLFIIFAAILLIFGISFLIMAKKLDEESQRRIKLAYGLFGVFYGTCRVLFIIIFQDFSNPPQNYDLIANIAYSFGMVGFTSIIWALEKAKYETKYLFLINFAITIMTVSGVLLNLLGIAIIREIVLIIITLGTPIAGFFIIFLYIQLIRLSSGELRKKAIYTLLGFLIMASGITLDGQFFLAIEVIPIWFKMDAVPILCIGGYFLFSGFQFK
ncbi:MAG: hypothetical protein ACTSRG_07000 [Candidatus Helarchaeota archaeon]